MKKKALVKDAYREIKKSLGRFFSIMLIVALGVAFLAGIQVSSPMMKDTTDQYMDDYQMMDLRVLSTLGLEEKDVEAISKLDQVEHITGSYSLNALVTLKDGQKVIKVHSLQDLSSEDEEWINKPMLIEGRWPSAPNECLIDGSELTRLSLEIGDSITLETGTDKPISDVLTNRTYQVVGIMNSPYYMHYERGTAEIGNGLIESYIYIPKENFKNEIYTELFMTLKGAKVLDSYSEAYTSLVEDFKARLEPIVEERALERYEKLLEEGKLELEEGKEQLKQLKEPKVYVLDREANYGFANYKSAAETIERIGKIFPIFFFVVAALVCLTTMTRMIDEQRTTIGTYKALGYSSFSIMSKYILYAGLASIIGSLLGIIVGVRVFPHTIYNAYGMMFTAPPLINKFYPLQAMSAILVMTALTTFAVIFTTMKALKEQPSELMRPKAPPAGKRILLERMSFIWKRLSFFQKVVARNIFRYKKKFFMTTIGIAGCSALLVAGLGLKESIISIVDRQYGDLFQYDLEVTLKEEGVEKLEQDGFIQNALEVTNENIKAIYGEKDRSVTLRIIHDIDKLPRFIGLRERGSQKSLSLDEGVIISEKLATALEAEVGDVIQFEKSDLEMHDVKVIGITENYIGHYMYMSAAYNEQVTNQKPVMNQLLVQLKDTSAKSKEVLSNALTQNDEVISFAFTTRHAQSFDRMTASLNTVVMILIISAALLAFIVLYNLTTINISERYREIATIKVLGFNDFKVSQYIYRENMILTLIGALLGLVLGKMLFLFIIVTAEMDEMMFGREIYPSSYITAFILTFIFAITVHFMMHFKLQKIEMVESLKSVE